MIKIPIFSDQSSIFTMNIELNSISVDLTLTYNIRNERWYISLVTENNSLYYRKLVENFPLVYPHKAIFPELSGDFFVIKNVNKSDNMITYENLGNGWDLFYYDESEMQDWADDNGIIL